MVLVSTCYENLVSKGEISFDPAQFALAKHFDSLLHNIAEKPVYRSWKLLNFLKRIKHAYVYSSRNDSASNFSQGLYIYGGVGRGKTMLMDLFFSCLPQDRKRRAHFNDFMANIHERVDIYRKTSKYEQTSPILAVAEDLSREAQVLCFDEFSVTDIADAMVLGRLVSALFDKGTFFVATSNVAPRDLYHNGLNRELFLPFIQVLEKHVQVINLDTNTDYRLEKLNLQYVYMTPLGIEANERMDQAWKRVLQGQKEVSDEISVKGRFIRVPRSGMGCARFDYQDLCVKPLSASEYLALGERYHTIFVDNVPVMDDTCRNEVKRFILFIDVLYERHMRLFMSAAAKLENLYKGYAKTTETFEFKRTESRLFEMQSQDYLNIWSERFLLKKKK
ncbi:cell division protein ZapE [Bartonella sp. B41]